MLTRPRLVALLLTVLLASCVQSAAPRLAPTAGAPAASELAAQPTIPAAALGSIARRDVTGQLVDAHDGDLKWFGNRFWLYGTQYGCGGPGANPTNTFCGFAAYSSPDLVAWTYEGQLFAQNSQAACVPYGGCFRPKVVYNAAARMYVLWWNRAPAIIDGLSQGVAVSRTPRGPFVEVPRHPCCGGEYSGDESLFVDSDGSAYAVTTEVFGCHPLPCDYSVGHLAVTRLDANYTAPTDQTTMIELPGRSVEAPSMFRRGALYYVIMSDPGCPYCTGTGSGYLTAPTALGPWTYRGKISQDSCHGQPNQVTQLPGGYLYTTDQWLGILNEHDAKQWWGALAFNPDGSLVPIVC